MLPPAELLSALSSARLLVLGDIISDHYVRGSVERTSPEAPVPVVLYEDEKIIPGGAANVSRNILDVGAGVFCVGVTGDDNEGERLCTAMEERKITAAGVVRVAGRPTTVKTRIVSQNQQILRLDRETSAPVEESVENRLLEYYRAELKRCGAVVLSDYGKGVLTPRVLSEAIRLADEAGVPLFVDPKGRDYRPYHGAFGLTPNLREAAEASGISAARLAGSGAAEALSAAAKKVHEQAECNMLVITRGAEGLALFENFDKASHEPVSSVLMPTFAREVFDVTGAGDTFIAFLALGTAAGLTSADAAHLANAAAGIVVGKVGAATVSPAELRGALSPEARLGRKLRSPEEMEQLGKELRAGGRRIVFTNGCFDFLHAGHVALLEQARAMGDVLVLATNSDDMIERLKGAPRPILRQPQRERLLAAIESVDYVVVFPDETPHNLLQALKPDILVKGDNYSRVEIEGREVVESYGGEVRLLPTLEDISTRELIAQRRK